MPLPFRYNLDRMAVLKDLEYYSNINAACSIVKKMVRLDPGNDQLKLLSDSLVQIFFWGNQQEQDRRIYNSELSEMRLAKNRAVTRARKAEKAADDLKAEIKKLKAITNL